MRDELNALYNRRSDDLGNDPDELFTGYERAAFDALALAMSLGGGETEWEAADVDGLAFCIMLRDQLMFYAVEYDPDGPPGSGRVTDMAGTVHVRGTSLAWAALRQARSLTMCYQRQRSTMMQGLESALTNLEMTGHLKDHRWSYIPT